MARDARLIDRYLRLLGRRDEEPSLAYLRELALAQSRNVPYENVSKLLRFDRPGLATFEEFVRDAEETGAGGTCHTQNGMFAELLRSLGFRAELVGVSSDYGEDHHASVRVRLPEGSYVVDLGLYSSFCGPFPLAAGTVIEETIGSMSYRFAADIPGETYRLTISRDGAVIRSHRANPPARDLAYFSGAVRATFSRDALFMGTLAVHRGRETGPAWLWGRKLGVFEGAVEQRRDLNNPEELLAAFAGELELPKLPVLRAVGILEAIQGKPFF